MAVRLRIRERDRRLSHPENPRRNTAQSSAKENELLGSKPILGTQPSCVLCITHCSEYQDPFDANEADDYAAEATGDDHQTELEDIGAVD